MKKQQYQQPGSHKQMSDAFITAVFLTLSGGFQDAYTYFCRGGVFANAQTGNIVLMSQYLFRLDLKHAARFMIPLIAFIGGIFVAELVHRRLKYIEKLHWRQIVLCAEILLLICTAFIPFSFNILANALVSFVCAMQVQTFRKVEGSAYASTMCIGNLRSGTEALCAYFHTKEPKDVKKSLRYFGVIVLFGIGAGIGSVASRAFGKTAILFSCLLLFCSFLFMFIKEHSRKETG